MSRSHKNLSNVSRLPLLLLSTGGVVAAAAMLGGSTPAFAQDATTPGEPASADRLEDVIVVARKRDESVMDVPVAISVFSQAAIEAGNLDEVDEFVALTPNAKITADSETSSEISLRGSTRNVQDEDPSVGIYRDGIYIGGRLFSTATFYDTQRVEVLRGPQAGLYGRNAVGGALNVISNRPALGDFSGYAEAQAGSKDRQELNGAVNIPLGDTAALRISGLLVNQDRGFEYIVNQDHYVDAGETGSIRGRLLFAPTPNLDFLTTVEYIDTKGFQHLLIDSPGGTQGFLDGEDFEPIPPGYGYGADDTDNQYRDWPTFQSFEQTQISQEVNWTLGGAGTLTGILSYRDSGFKMSRDDDYTILDISGRRYNAEQQSTFAELRFASDDIGGFNYIVGLNYLNEDIDLSYRSKNGGDVYAALGGYNLAEHYADGTVGFGLTPFLTGLSGYLGDSSPIAFDNVQTLDSLSAFGEAYYEINPQWEVWGNARATRDEKDIVFGQNFVDCPACTEFVLAFFGVDFNLSGENSATFENVSVGGGVNWRPTDDILAYAKVVQGFKAGGFNPQAVTIEDQAFDSETTIGYEIGVKSSWFENRMRLTLSAFVQDREDALVETADPNFSLLTLGVNAGKIRNQGVEAELAVLPLDGLRMDFAVGLLDAKFEDFVDPGDPSIDYTGNAVPKTFEKSFSAIVTYERPIAAGLGLYTFASYSNAWDGFADNSNIAKLDSPETVNLAAGVESDSGWRIGGFINNATDNRYISLYQLAREGGERRGSFAPGRTYGVQVKRTF